MNEKAINQLLIASVTPYFLEKQVFWFEENLKEILDSIKTQTFFQENVTFIKAGQQQNLSEFSRGLVFVLPFLQI